MSVIYMDVGGWGSGDLDVEVGQEMYVNKNKEEDTPSPQMTFGLIEHNAIALCDYYSDGKGLGKITEKTKYNFKISLINKFLTTMMENKYGKVFKIDDAKGKDNLKFRRYHIKDMITFNDYELLDTKNQLIIIIPDLHLHLFKGTYLDNFITWKESSWKNNRPTPSLISRRSMEGEFFDFINTIIDCKMKYNIEENVTFIGDTVELWESLEAIRTFYYMKGKSGRKNMKHDKDQKDQYSKEYYNIAGLVNDLDYYLGGLTSLGKCMRELNKLNISKGEVDSRFLDSINALSDDTVKRLLIKATDSSSDVRDKAKLMKKNILDRYWKYSSDVPRKKITLTTLLETLEKVLDGGLSDKNHVDYIYGNHDNFLSELNFKLPNTNISYKELYDKYPIFFKPNYGSFKTSFKSKNSMFIITHGHNWDKFNKDDDFEFAYMLTKISMLYESKGRSGPLKYYDAEVCDRDKYKEYINETLQFNERFENIINTGNKDLPLLGGNKEGIKNKVVIMGHTHIPYLEIISE